MVAKVRPGAPAIRISSLDPWFLREVRRIDAAFPI